jgi:tRNA A-37 threonylcarbamoyl transferase component Bud32
LQLAEEPEVAGPPGYEILSELGRSGMGVVYKARHLKLNRIVALKMNLGGEDADRDDRERLLHEAQAIAVLTHPGIVRIHEVGTHEGLPYFALEFCEGGSLEGKLSAGPLPPSEAASILEQAARALHAAHTQGIVHGDLKPANLLLDQDGQVRVGGFGPARLEGSGLTSSGVVLGTPSYMAPEQAGEQKEIGPAADIWALGAILYECLTGRPPFKGATAFETLMQVTNAEPVPPRKLNAAVPIDQETVCLRCLNKNPARRYGSALDLAEDLARFRRGEAVRARPVGRIERGYHWCRRNPVMAGLVTLAVVLLAGTSVLTIMAVDARTRAAEADRQRNQAEKLAREEAAARAEAEKQGGDTTVRVWDAEKGTQLLTLKGHTGRVNAAAFSADGKRIISGSEDTTVRVWDADKGTELHTLYGHTGGVTAVAFSPDGKRLVSGSSDKTVRVWNAENGQEVLSLTGHTSEVRSVAFSADGKRIGSSSGELNKPGEVKVWDAVMGQEILSLNGHPGWVSGAAFSPDGKRIVSGSLDPTAR